MKKRHNPALMVEIDHRVLADDERVALRDIYVRHLERLKAKPEGRGPKHSVKTMAARQATLAEALGVLSGWREVIQWALDGGHYRVKLVTWADVQAGRAQRQRSNRVAEAFAKLKRGGCDLDPRWDAEASPESFLAFVLEAGQHVQLGAILPVEGRIGPGCYAIKRDKQVGVVKEQPKAEEVEDAWSSIIGPVLAGRDGEDTLTGLLTLDGSLASTVKIWRKDHIGGICHQWSSMQTYRYIYTVFAYLLRYDLIRQPGQEYHRLDTSLPWGPGNIGLRSRSANPHRLTTTSSVFSAESAALAA